MQFYDNNPKWKAKADELKAEVAYWHNQCHDAAVDGSPVPDALAGALRVAEKNLAAHRRAESDRYFAACKAGEA